MRRFEHAANEHKDLARIPGFSGCTPRQLAQIDRLTDRATSLPGHVLLREGAIGRELYIVLSGTATVTRHGRLITTIGPGDYFGELAAIETGHRNATLTAISTLTVLIVGPREFGSLMADVPGFRDVILRGMARRLRAADDTIERMTNEIETVAPLGELRPFMVKGPAVRR